MFTRNPILRIGLFLTISIVANACAVGEIGDSGGAGRLAPSYDPTPIAPSQPVESGLPLAPACPEASADVSAANGWRSSEASLPALDGLYFEFKARPTAADLDGLIAVGAEDIDAFTKAAIAVRFADDGLVDARDGAFYSSDVVYAYDPGVWYTVAISAELATETYDVEIGPCGEPRETLIKGASFRSDADVSDRLNTWAVWSSQAAALELATPTWMASGGCAPATCQSLGQECGQPSNGCGGSLNCGSCESGEACASGLCVDNSTPPPAPPAPPGGGAQPERPWADNTGPSGTLTPWSYGSTTLTTDGATYENFSGGSQITINADNVTLRNFRITGGTYGIKIENGHSGIVIEDGEISNTGTGILGVGYTGRRLYIHDQQHDGTKAQGSGGATLVEYSFFEKLGMADGSHADGQQTASPSGARNVTFRYNNIWMPAVGPNSPGAPYKSNAAFMNSGTITNFVIESNWLNGGNYTIYCQQGGTNVSGISVRNNRFGRDYRYGTISGTCDELAGNVWDDTGDPI